MAMQKKSFTKSFRELMKHPVPPLLELLTTEKHYIAQLELVVNGYMAEYLDENSPIPVPGSLKGYKGVLFGNIKDIYEWHKNYFLPELIKHQNSLTEVGKIFTQNEHQFHMYSKYCNKNHMTNYLLTNDANYFSMVKNKLNHNLSINDLLITPVQRLGRYRLLLSEIIKHFEKKNLTEHLESLNAALKIIQTIGNSVNDYTAIQHIHNFDRQISEQGKLLIHGNLTCKYDGKKLKQYVFLFQQLIIFTKREEPKNKYVNATYKFFFQIPMNKLQLSELPNNQFMVKSMNPIGGDREIVCKADTIELHQQWLEAIMDQLAAQRKLIQDLVSPNEEGDAWFV